METIVIKYKQKLEYKKCEFRENVRPAAIWTAIHYLLEFSELFQEQNIILNTTWLNKSHSENSINPKHLEICESDYQNAKDVSMKYGVQNTVSAKNDSISKDKRYCKTLENDDDFLIDNKNLTKYGKNCETLDCQEDLEIDEDSNAIHQDTLLHISNIYPNDPEYPTELTFAPGEGHTPVSIFDDVDVEYLAFPTIFCG